MMKKIILNRLALVIMALGSHISFSQCENVNGDMQSGNFPVSGNQVDWINADLDNWFVSHEGGGTVVVLNDGGDHSIELHAFEGISNGGIFTNFEFEENHYYELTYEVDDINFINDGIEGESGQLFARLANDLLPQTSGSSMPSTDGTLLVSTWLMTPGETSVTISTIFEATDDYSQLWLFSQEIDNPALYDGMALNLDNICIREIPCYAVDAADVEINHTIVTGPIFMPFGAVEAVDFSVSGIPTTDYIVEYSWSFGDGSPESTSASPHHFYYAYGAYNVCVNIMYKDPVTLETICSQRICKTIRLDISTGKKLTEGTDHQEKSNAPISSLPKFAVFPNPNQGIFTISAQGEFSINTVHIYSTTGQLIYKMDDLNESNTCTIEQSQLENGIYMLVLNQGFDHVERMSVIIR